MLSAGSAAVSTRSLEGRANSSAMQFLQILESRRILTGPMEALPFTIKNKPGEAGTVTGLCRIDDNSLRVEWNKTSLIKRHAKSETLDLSFQELESVKYKWGFFSARLIIRPRTLSLISDVPGAHASGELHLRIARKDRAIAKELASSADFALADHRIDRLGRSIGL